MPSGLVGLTLKAGDKVQHFVVLEQIGTGGTSAVFKAHDALLNRHVAIKQVLLAPGEESDAYRTRILSEAAQHKKAAAADPSMLVQLMDVVSDPRGMLLIMEYVDGPSLEQILTANPTPMEERQAMGIIAGIAKGLVSLHGAGVLHRDLKPANILMPRSGGLRISDFGLSVSAGLQQTMDQGTVRYLAPEILQGQPATQASDLYALGMIAYETLVGRAQFDEAFKAILRDQRNQSMRWVKWHTNPRIKAVPLNQLCPNLPPAAVELVERLMDKDPLRRIASASDLLEAIRRIFVKTQAPAGGAAVPGQPAGGQTEGFAPASGGDTARIPQRRKWPLIAASAGVLLVLAALAASQMNRKQTPEELAAIDRNKAVAWMREAEDAWNGADYQHALELFQDMQDGGKKERKAGTVSRLFADAGVAKCKAILAENKQDYTAAAVFLGEFRRTSAAMDAAAKNLHAEFPSQEVGVSTHHQDLADRMDKRIAPRKEAADAIAEIRKLLDDSKTTECLTKANEWLARPDLVAYERQKIQDLVAQCGKSKKELILERLLNAARQKAKEGDTRQAREMLLEEKRTRGESVDPRVDQVLAEIDKDANFAQLVARYEQSKQSNSIEDKIASLNAVLRVQPDYKDKAALPALKATQFLEWARKAIQENDLNRAGALIKQGLDLAPDQPELKSLKDSIARIRQDSALVTAADTLFDQGKHAEAINAYGKVIGELRDPAITDSAKTRIKLCKGLIKKAEGLAFLTQSDLNRAEAALQAAKTMLDDDQEITTAFQYIADLRAYQGLRETADASFAKKNYDVAVPQYIKVVDFLKAHADIDNLENAADRLRICRFESKFIQFQEAMSRKEWNSANGYVSAAENYARTPDEKARVKEAHVQLNATPGKAN